jgi:anti-anti-sigma factor
MEINIAQEGDKRVRFVISGKIDEAGAEKLKARFMELNRSALNEAVFDLKNVNHIGSAGIGKLLLFYKDLAVNGGGIRIVNVPSSIYDLFKVLKLDTIFDVSKS